MPCGILQVWISLVGSAIKLHQFGEYIWLEVVNRNHKRKLSILAGSVNIRMHLAREEAVQVRAKKTTTFSLGQSPFCVSIGGAWVPPLLLSQRCDSSKRVTLGAAQS